MTSFHTVCVFNSFHVRARFEKYPTNDQETDRVECEIYIRLVNKNRRESREKIEKSKRPIVEKFTGVIQRVLYV